MSFGYFHFMRLLRSTIHPELSGKEVKQFTRNATRAIVLDGDNILLLYTQRYHDYSLPGGGIDKGEDNIAGLIRELTEETGAQNITNIREFGLYEELRPWYKHGYNAVHMLSYCYQCDINKKLAEPALEKYEIQNGMTAKWINIHEAINHNQNTMANSTKKGLSIERETFLLELIVKELLS